MWAGRVQRGIDTRWRSRRADGRCAGRTGLYDSNRRDGPSERRGRRLAGSGRCDDEGSCGGAGFKDVVYGIDLPDDTGLLVATDFPQSTSNTLIHIRRDCADPSTELACDKSGGINEDGAYRLVKPGAGRYHVFIDEESGGSSGYRATIQMLLPLGAACNPTIGREICAPDLNCIAGTCQPAMCAGGTTVTVSNLGTQMIGVNTTGLTSDHAGTCGEGNDGGARGPDETVVIDLQLAARLEIRTDNPGTNYDTLIYLRGTCEGPEIACNDDGPSTGPSAFTTAMLAPGQYLLIVDGFSYNEGTAEISIRSF